MKEWDCKKNIRQYAVGSEFVNTAQFEIKLTL